MRQPAGRPAKSAADRAVAAPETASWHDLIAELDRWAAAGRRATFWWRDDDAEALSPRLERLLALSHPARGRPVPLGLAVIPAAADPALAARLRPERHVRVLQHGWAHANHAPADERTIELGDHRPLRMVLAELDRGRSRLEGLFGRRFIPVIVPPWNRIAPRVARALPRRGFGGLSASGPRPRRRPASAKSRDFAAANVHIDIFAWRPRARFIGTGKALAQAVRHLAARRSGQVDPDEPTGLMTHHRQHDAACWRFVARFLAVTAAHPAVRWLPADRLFAAPVRPASAAPARKRRSRGLR
jgi:hypothetical protein